MLITDNSKGTSDGKERDQLQAMVAVGSEFITHTDPESTVQKSGEFVRIEKESGEAAARFLLLHETSQTYDEAWNTLTGNELRSVAPNVKLRKRSRLYVSEIDPMNGDLPFREIGGFKAQTRIARHHGPTHADRPRQYEAVNEANYTAQAGKRRLFPKGDGNVWMVREVVVPGDARYFNDSMGKVVDTPMPHSKKRGLRAARVEVVDVNTTNGVVGKPVFSFDVHSGLGFDAEAKIFSGAIRASSADLYDTTNVYAAFSGVLFGSSLNIPSVLRVPAGGDASDTYAVAEPAVAKAGGKEYTSWVAVYPAPDDVYDSRSAGPYRLTCKRMTPEGDAVTSKISFQPLPALPQHYLAVRGLSLHRTSPNTVVLRVNVHAMQFAAGGSTQPVNSDVLFFWTQDNGATWTYAPVAAGFPGVFPYGGLVVKDKGTLLAFSWWPAGSTATTLTVHQITSAGTASFASVPASTFNAGLMEPLTSGTSYTVPYTPVGFGGATYKKGTDDKKHKRLWIQFDPYWIYEQSNARTLDYPGARPMLLVSDDGGTTWARRLLPVPWAFRVGFVVPISEKALAVPVLSPRKAKGSPVAATIYVSEDGGDTWKPSPHKVTLPGETWADGNIVFGATYLDGHGDLAFEQDIGDSALEFNRGELLPMLALRDKEGRLLPANPARPWMNDHKIKEPDYA